MTVSWITTEDVLDYVGMSTVAPDDPWLIRSTEAANEWARRRRRAAGYIDDVDEVSPGGDVTAGTAMYAGAVFRARGSADGFSSFEEFVDSAGGSMGAGWTQVKRLLGIPRPVAV